MKKIFAELFELFVKTNKREPNAIETLQLKFKASQQVGKGEVIEFPRERITDWTKARPQPPEIEIIDGVQTTRGLGDLFERQMKNLSGELTSVPNKSGQSGLSYKTKNKEVVGGTRESVKKEAVEKYGISPARADEIMDSQFDEKLGDDLLREAEETSPLMSKIENRISGMRDETEAATGIMATVDKGDLPAKTGAAREFLVNSLKVGDDYPSTTLSDVMSAEDMKYIFEGGGGAMGDPLVLVQKYFGPRIAEMIPNGGSSEEIAIFTKRVMNNVEDAKGLKPDEEGFDSMTARFIDEFTPPEGGQPFANGGLAKILEL